MIVLMFQSESYIYTEKFLNSYGNKICEFNNFNNLLETVEKLKLESIVFQH